MSYNRRCCCTPPPTCPTAVNLTLNVSGSSPCFGSAYLTYGLGDPGGSGFGVAAPIVCANSIDLSALDGVYNIARSSGPDPDNQDECVYDGLLSGTTTMATYAANPSGPPCTPLGAGPTTVTRTLIRLIVTVRRSLTTGDYIIKNVQAWTYEAGGSLIGFALYSNGSSSTGPTFGDPTNFTDCAAMLNGRGVTGASFQLDAA